MNPGNERELFVKRLRHVRKRKSALARITELFYTFLFAVTFGVISALVAEYLDNAVRHTVEYPVWYIWTLFIVFAAMIVGLIIMFIALRSEERELELMEKNFEEMVPDEPV